MTSENPNKPATPAAIEQHYRFADKTSAHRPDVADARRLGPQSRLPAWPKTVPENTHLVCLGNPGLARQARLGGRVMYRARFAECLRAHTALLGTYLTIPDEPTLIDALVDLARELASGSRRRHLARTRYRLNGARRAPPIPSRII